MAAAKKKAAKKAVAKDVYIVTYDIIDSGDPVKVFDTLEKAKSFVEELFTEGDGDWGNDDIEKSSIKVYKAQLVGAPKIEIVFK